MIPALVEAGKSTKSVVVDRKPFVVPGFRVSAVASGMRYPNRPDLALIHADGPVGAKADGVFTTNRFAAAPVELCKERLKAGAAKAVVVNAGIANACTGSEGLKRAEEMTRMIARSLNVPESSVLVASTGVIGQQVLLEPFARSVPELAKGLRPDGWEDVAQAIMTTDLVPKLSSTQVSLNGKLITVGGVAKGSGMIAPDMATLLAFVCTDVSIELDVLKHWVRWGADRSFNRITVDGDTSTNDSLLVLASGCAENPVLRDVGSPESRLFGEALEAVFLDLAKQIVYDGEGATKFIEIEVTGAPDEVSAKAVALTVANSPLVKTAFFGEDANWGRIVAAAGRAGVPLHPDRVTLYFGTLCVFRDGLPLEGKDVEEKASRVFRQKEIKVRLDLGMGKSQFRAYTCDFSYDYVKINGSYRS